MRRVESIGEAARPASEDVRRPVPGSPWPIIDGLSHALGHKFCEESLDQVLEVVMELVRELLSRLRPPIEALEYDVEKDETCGPEAP